MSRGALKNLNASLGFPRVSGDEPPAAEKLEATFGFSPRERG